MQFGFGAAAMEPTTKIYKKLNIQLNFFGIAFSFAVQLTPKTNHTPEIYISTKAMNENSKKKFLTKTQRSAMNWSTRAHACALVIIKLGGNYTEKNIYATMNIVQHSNKQHNS